MNQLCQCGCGKEVTNKNNKFISGHNMKGIKRLKESILKGKATCIELYGGPVPYSSIEIRKKGTITHTLNTGYDHPAHNPNTREKAKLTNIEKTGYDNPLKNPTILDQIKLTNIEKTGYDNPFKNPEIQEKIKKNYKEKTGYDNSMQNPEVKEKTRQTNIKKYGKIHWAKTSEGRTFHRIHAIKCIEDQQLHGEPLMPRIGIQERPVLNELQLYTTLKILRQDHRFVRGNNGIGRFPDGYIEELKLVILYHERSVHYLDNNCTIETEDTIQTTKDYESIGLTVFKISEYDWKENKEQIINNFKGFII